jgi:translocation and assembly module TamB
MKSTTKLLMISTAAGATLALIGFCGAVIWINSTHGRQWVQARVSHAIPGSVSIGGHHLSLLPPGIDLHDVSLSDPAGRPVAGFSRFRVQAGWLPLLDLEIHLKVLLLEAPWVRLQGDPDGGTNLMESLVADAGSTETDAAAAPPTGWPLNIVAESIRLTRGRFVFASSDHTLQLESSGIELTAAGDLLARSGNLDLAVARLVYTAAGLAPMPVRLSARAHLNGSTLNLAALELVSPQMQLGLSGVVSHLYGGPSVDAVLTANGRLEVINALFERADTFAGRLKAEVSMKGSLADPDARLNVTVADGRIAGQPLDRGVLSLSLHERRATIDRAVIQLADGTVDLTGHADLGQAFKAGLLSPPSDIDAVAYDLGLTVDIPVVDPWLNHRVDLSGGLAGRLALAGKGVTPEAVTARLTLDATGRDLLAPGMDRSVHPAVRIAVQAAGATVDVSRFEVTEAGMAISGHGRYRMDNQSMSAHLSAAIDNLSRITAVAGGPSVGGTCDLTVDLDGALPRPQGRLSLAATDLSAGPAVIGNLTVQADLAEDGRLDLTAIDIQNRDARIHGTGRVRLLEDGWALDPAFDNTIELTAERLVASQFMPSPPVDGTVDGRLLLNGPLTSLQGKLALDASRLHMNSTSIGDVAAGLRLDAGTVHVDRLQWSHLDSAATIHGRIQLLVPGTLNRLTDPPFDLAIDSDHVDPGAFSDSIKGTFMLHGQASGTVDAPIGQITVAGQAMDLAGQPVDAMALDARFDAGRLWVDRLLATVVPGETIEGSGWLALDRTLALRLRSDGVAIERIQGFADRLPAGGRIRFDLEAAGRMDNPTLSGQLTAEDVTLNDEAVDDLHLTFHLEDMRAAVSGNLNFDVDAACDLREGDFSLQLAFDDTETAPYFRAVGRPNLHGVITGTVDASGNIREPANLSATVDLEAVRLLAGKTPLVTATDVGLKLADRELSIADFSARLLTAGNLRLRGKADLDGHLDIHLDARLPVAAAQAFSDLLVDSTGIVSLTGHLGGDAAKPEVNGRIDLDAIGMLVPGVEQRLQGLNGRIDITTDRIRIEALEGRLGTGSFRLEGSMAHDAFMPSRIDLGIRARSLPIEITDTMAVLLNGDISITGQDRTADARGEIVLLEGVYHKEMKIGLLQLASSATERRRTVAPASKPVSVPWFDTVRLDIAIGHRQPFEVDNNLAELAISPDLTIGGTLDNPIISGRAQVREGTITFQKKRFEVQKGVIDFINPYRTEAEIDVASQTTIRTWTIHLSLKGTPDNLDMTLRSEPVETESDILSLILFGRTARELTAGEGGGQQTTGQIMAEMISETFGKDIKKTTGVDILQLETTDGEDAEDAGGIKVTVGKHLSDRMTVKYAIETKDGETTQRAITEYKLLEHILVSGFQDTAGVHGSELTFRIEFR